MSTVQSEPVVYAFQTEQGGWRVAGSRVSLDSVIYAYRQGESPEQIVGNFPALSLEQVYGAIAFYLHNREVIDQYLEQQQARWEELRKESEERNRPLLERLRAEKARRAAAE